MAQTRIDPEEFAYPAGSIRQSRRKGLAIFPDGKIRTVTLGIPDTYWTIPARAKARGKTLSGFVSFKDDGELHFNAQGVNACIFNT